MKNNNLNLICW